MLITGDFFFGFGTLSEQHILHKGPPGSAVGPGGQNIDLDVVGLEARGLSSFLWIDCIHFICWKFDKSLEQLTQQKGDSFSLQ